MSLRQWFLIVGCCALAAVGLHADTTVRMVQISFVQGAVEIQLPDGHGWRPALLEQPVEQGDVLRTLAKGQLEIELENGSTVRLISNSEIKLPLLARNDHGATLTSIQLARGTAFVSLRSGEWRGFTMHLASGAGILPRNNASFRVEAAAAAADRVTVLNGEVLLKSGGRSTEIKKNEVARWAPGRPAMVASNPAPADIWEKWSEGRDRVLEAQLHSGIAPGSLASTAWWQTGGMAAPTFFLGLGANSGIEPTRDSNCPWMETAGVYTGWCWDPLRGWFMPASGIMQAGLITGYGTCDPSPLFLNGPVFSPQQVQASFFGECYQDFQTFVDVNGLGQPGQLTRPVPSAGVGLPEPRPGPQTGTPPGQIFRPVGHGPKGVLRRLGPPPVLQRAQNHGAWSRGHLSMPPIREGIAASRLGMGNGFIRSARMRTDVGAGREEPLQHGTLDLGGMRSATGPENMGLGPTSGSVSGGLSAGPGPAAPSVGGAMRGGSGGARIVH